MKLMSNRVYIITIIMTLLLLKPIPVSAFERLSCFCSGQTPNSAITHWAIYSPGVDTITVSWTKCKPGDFAIVRYQDPNGCYLPNTEVPMESSSGSYTFTAPADVKTNTLVIGTGKYYGMRYLWYSNITYDDGTTVNYPDPYQIDRP